MLLSAKIGSEFSFVELSKIENARLDVRDLIYNKLIQSFCDLFNIDSPTETLRERNWVEQIRSQTEPQPLDLSKAVFPVHINCCLTDGH